MATTQLLGGPADGKEVDVPDGAWEVRALAEHVPSMIAEPEDRPLRVAIYKPHTDGSWRHTGWA